MQGKVDPASLRYYMSVQITNEMTKRLIARALGANDLEDYPGELFGMGESDNLSEKALALLGK